MKKISNKTKYQVSDNACCGDVMVSLSTKSLKCKAKEKGQLRYIKQQINEAQHKT